MKIRITPQGFSVVMTYDDDKAELTIVCAGKRAVYDEDECDRLLRVIECAQDPIEDLTEFFQDDFGMVAYRVAVQYHDRAQAIAEQVYA